MKRISYVCPICSASMLATDEIDYRKLSEDIADVIIEALQYFEHIDKNGPPQTFEEATKSISGGIERYRSDPIFRAKVQMLVSRITATVQGHDVPNT